MEVNFHLQSEIYLEKMPSATPRRQQGQEDWVCPALLSEPLSKVKDQTSQSHPLPRDQGHLGIQPHQTSMVGQTRRQGGQSQGVGHCFRPHQRNLKETHVTLEVTMRMMTSMTLQFQ